MKGSVTDDWFEGLYNQYTHMIRQRRKNIRGKKRA
jgi:hypothetical protein